MKPALTRRIHGLLFGGLFGVLAVALRASLQPLLGDQLPFAIAFPATVASAVLWGSGAGSLTALFCALAVASPAIAPDLLPANRPLQIGAFLVGSTVVAVFCGRLRAARAAEQPVLADDGFESPLTAWLRTVLWGALLGPAVAFGLISWWGYERAEHDAGANVSHACELIYEHARRTYAVAAEIAARADDAAAGPADAVRSHEAAIHQRLADIASGVPWVVNLNVWNADGRLLARNDVFPVDTSLSIADRSYFIEQRTRPQRLGISEVIRGRISGAELTSATVRRRTADGHFDGIVAVSIAPSHFRDYYASLATEQPNLASFALVRTDGTIVARWPPNPSDRTRVPVDSPILARIAANQTEGSLTLPATPEREARIRYFRRLPDLPLYVVAGVSQQAMLADWVRFVALMAGVLLPTGAGLAYVTWVALKKTRREALTAAALREQIHRRASAEQSLQQAQKFETLAVVTGGVAHDFNNLLAVVTASLHVLKRRQPELAEQKQVQAMTRAVQSGVRLTRQLLSFSRKQALRPETIALQRWLPANEALLRSTLGATIAWRLHVEPDTRGVYVDMGELELALINLVVNARHAMPEGGALEVTAGNDPATLETGAPRVLIAVTDTGVGIAPELLGRVVEPFFTTREKGAGSGLGLSQVKGFCTEAGGTLWIESRLGAGTSVRLALPASKEALAPDAPARLEASALPLGGRVLLVEDNEDVGATTAMLLRTAGLEVARCLDADSALAHLAGTPAPPDVVLSDIAMPGSMNGIELAFTLGEKHPTLPVLLTTGYADQLDRAVAGGLRVLQKPVAPEDLLAELRALMEARQGGARRHAQA